MGRLNQIHLQFSPLEDRQLLLIKTEELAEFRFWLTRRFVKLLWPVLLQALARDDAVRSQPDPEKKEAVISFQHESAVQQSDFKTVYRRELASTPLGTEPVLLAKAALKPGPDGQQVLCLHPLEGRGVELAVSPMMLHSLCKLLAETVHKSDWDLELGIARRATDPGSRSMN